MSLRFRVNGPLDFNNIQYVIVFNTSGSTSSSNGMPYANALTTGFQNYSYAWIVGGTGTGAQAELVQYFVNISNGTIGTTPVVVPAGQSQLQVGTSGTQNEFTLQFARALFNQPNPSVATSPNPAPTTTAQQTWFINFFTANANPQNGQVGTAIDANGTTGIQDTSFILSIPTQQVVTGSSGIPNNPYIKPAGSSVAGSNPAAQINQTEVDNNP